MVKYREIKSTGEKSKRKSYDIVTKAMIVESRRQGNSYRAISEEFQVPISSIHRYVEKFRTTGSLETAKRTGRPRKTSAKTDNFIKLQLKRNNSITSSELTEIPGLCNVSSRTIRRRIVESKRLITSLEE